MMRKRDKAILDDLGRFRAMSRDQIIALHFSTLQNKVGNCNAVMKRLQRDGYVEVDKNRRPYVYFPSPCPIKKTGQKVEHYLAIVDFYRDLMRYEKPRQFVVEPKYGKQYMEPDAFMIWKGAPFFVEVQLSVYSEKVMREKMDRYMRYAESGEWKRETWQPANRKVFPYIWIVADHQYNIEAGPLRVFQSRNVAEFLARIA